MTLTPPAPVPREGLSVQPPLDGMGKQGRQAGLGWGVLPPPPRAPGRWGGRALQVEFAAGNSLAGKVESRRVQRRLDGVLLVRTPMSP